MSRHLCTGRYFPFRALPNNTLCRRPDHIQCHRRNHPFPRHSFPRRRPFPRRSYLRIHPFRPSPCLRSPCLRRRSSTNWSTRTNWYLRTNSSNRTNYPLDEGHTNSSRGCTRRQQTCSTKQAAPERHVLTKKSEDLIFGGAASKRVDYHGYPFCVQSSP